MYDIIHKKMSPAVHRHPYPNTLSLSPYGNQRSRTGSWSQDAPPGLCGEPSARSQGACGLPHPPPATHEQRTHIVTGGSPPVCRLRRVLDPKLAAAVPASSYTSALTPSCVTLCLTRSPSPPCGSPAPLLSAHHLLRCGAGLQPVARRRGVPSVCTRGVYERLQP